MHYFIWDILYFHRNQLELKNPCCSLWQFFSPKRGKPKVEKNTLCTFVLYCQNLSGKYTIKKRISKKWLYFTSLSIHISFYCRTSTDSKRLLVCDWTAKTARVCRIQSQEIPRTAGSQKLQHISQTTRTASESRKEPGDQQQRSNEPSYYCLFIKMFYKW